METSAFFFRYRRRDAATVRAVAAKLEITYQTLRTTLGLPPPLPNEKIGIEVTLTRSTNHPRTQSSVGETLTVLSPELITAPVEVTEVEVLYQAVAPKLVGRLLTETMRHYAFDPEVWSIKGALRLWLIGESGGPLAVVTHEMIQWLYLDLQGQAPIRWEGLPSTYDRICELHRVWGVSPLDLSLPLTCSKVHRARTERKPPLWSLVEPAPPLPIYNEYGELVDHVRHTNESIALATVFNYVVATYESKQFPLLLTALAAEERWETLTPASFDVSAEEFEHSWQLFLAERYGVPRSW